MSKAISIRKASMIVPLVIIAALLAPCQASDHGADYQIYPLRMKTGLGGHYAPNVSCQSWRLAVEAYNLRGFTTVPQECESYIGNYMLGDQYRSDSKTVCVQAYYHAKGTQLAGDGKDIWVFDVDETTLSNLPYYAENGFGVEPYNSTRFNAWVERGEAPALPETLKLYGKLLSLNIKPVFITGRPESQASVTAANLKNAGYHTWERLITKSAGYNGKTALVYKTAERKKLEEAGYRIIGNIGDQWSDILGKHVGKRTFKLPDPLYYIS